MIYYTLLTTSSFNVGEAVQHNGSTLEPHTTGEVCGVVMSCASLNDEGTEYETKVYVAGGGGITVSLGAAWNGQPTRFEFVNGRATPAPTGGDGWLIPEYPLSAKVAGDTAHAAIYR